MSELAERLGYRPDDKLLIVNCDDLGSSASANRAVGHAIAIGAATSATLMVPCPWALDGAERAQAGGIGVHLTLTCEYPAYRWRSLTGAASLHDAQGYMPSDIRTVWANADLGDVRTECRAQIEQAYAWGVDVTHLDAHMGAIQLEPRFHAIFLEMAAEFRLPVRMVGARTEAWAGFPLRAQAAAAGGVFPDHIIDLWNRPRGTATARVAALRPGVTELFFHPVEEGPELRSYDLREGDIRVGDYAEMCGAEFLGQVAASGARLISFKPLRDLMRAG